MRRRRVLTGIAAGSVAGLGGCASGDDVTITTSADNGSTPTDSGTTVTDSGTTATDSETPTESPTDSETPTATASPTPEPGAVVVAQGESFEPIHASISPGETVLWDNRTRGTYSSHTVTSAQFHETAVEWSYDRSFQGGETLTRAFDEPGVYEYVCTIHGESTMCGAILVGDVTLDESLPCE